MISSWCLLGSDIGAVHGAPQPFAPCPDTGLDHRVVGDHPDIGPAAGNAADRLRRGIEPLLWPRSAGSYPGFVFTDPPLSLASAHYGMGYGTGAHAPDEYFLIESANKNLDGFDGAALSYAEYFYELAK